MNKVRIPFGFVVQAKPVRFESAGAFALHTLPFGFNPGDARDKSLIRRVVLITPPFVGPFCRPVGAQSAAPALASQLFDTQKAH